jgi:HSP20 family protein
MNDNTQVAARDSKQQQMENAATLLPPVDIFEDESGFTLTADLPGVGKDTLRVKVDGDNLSIEGEGSVAVPEAMELVYAEIRAPYYRRSFTLSRELDTSKIEANLKDGVLKLRIPKAEEARPRRIEIKIG